MGVAEGASVGVGVAGAKRGIMDFGTVQVRVEAAIMHNAAIKNNLRDLIINSSFEISHDIFHVTSRSTRARGRCWILI